MLFKIACWYSSQKILAKLKIENLKKVFPEDILTIILEFIYCKECETFFDCKNKCCCLINQQYNL
jgi:hypothetical protein